MREKKKRKLSRIGLIVKDETREMLEDLCEKSDRSMTGMIENLIKIEYHKIKESGSRWVP